MSDHDGILNHEFNQLVGHVTRSARQQYHEQLEAYKRALGVCPACSGTRIVRDQAWVTDQGWVECLVCRACARQWQEPAYPVFQIRGAMKQTLKPLYHFVTSALRSGSPPERWRKLHPLRPDYLRSFHAESIRYFLKKHEWVLKDDEYRVMLSWPPEYFAAWGCRRFDAPGLVRRVMGLLGSAN